MLSEQLLNAMKMFADPSLYQDFSTSTEITNVINQLSLGQLNCNRGKYVLSCLNVAVLEALKSSLNKVDDKQVQSDLAQLLDELERFQLTLVSAEEAPH